MTTPIRRALLSVSDKTGIENFARMLAQHGFELISTGGTHAAIAAAGVPVVEVSDITGFPEMMNGRVKTLHPKIHGGILALRDNQEHVNAMVAHAIECIDLVVVNLYPFEEIVASGIASPAEIIEQIDIGGPSMVRSAAKNHRFVGIVTDPSDYGRVLDELQRNSGQLSEEFRRELAVKAFGLTARYDAAISRWMFNCEAEGGLVESDFPSSFSLAGVKQLEMRYGENPHQKAAFYRYTANVEPSVASAEVLSGKALSYNNIVDLDACFSLAKEFDAPFVCVAKHNNPCGAAVASTIEAALEQAWAGDPLSAFGSVLAFTRPVNLAAATFLIEGNRFVEAVIAPGFDSDAFDLLTTKPKWGKNVRLLAVGGFGPDGRNSSDIELKKVVGGFLLQDRDMKVASEDELSVATKTAPTNEQMVSLRFAEKVAKHVKSNAIVFVEGTRVMGVGAGQMSRVDSTHLAARKSGDHAGDLVMASDAFFPFPDGVEVAMDAGVTAIIQPGGSMRDQAVIDACDARNVPMVLTGARHFRH